MACYNGFELVTRAQLHELFDAGLNQSIVYNTINKPSIKIEKVTLCPVDAQQPITYIVNNVSIEEETKVFTSINISKISIDDLVNILNAHIDRGTKAIIFVTDNRSLYVNNQIRVIFIKKW